MGLEELIYSVRLGHDPEERIQASNVKPQPNQCTIQTIDRVERLRREDIVQFLKVKLFSYTGRILAVRPFHNIRSFGEVNTEDHVRNLTTAFKQTFEPMGIRLNAEANEKLTNWLSG